MPRTVTTEQHATLQAMLQRFEATLQPANQFEIIDLIAGLLRHFFTEFDRNAAGLFDQLQDWANDLAGYPVEAIRIACADWRKHQKFAPTPAHLLELLENIDERPFVIERLRRAVAIPIEDPAPETPLTPEDKQPLTGDVCEWGRMRNYAKANDIDWPDADQKAYLFGSVTPAWWLERPDASPSCQLGEAPTQGQENTFYDHKEQALKDWQAYLARQNPVLTTDTDDA